MTSIIVFYCIAAVVIISSLLVVTLKNLFHSALFLALSFVGIAGIYLFLGAEFLAAIQVLIYVGAIVTLIIFVIMLTARISDASIRQTNEQKFISFIVAMSIFILLSSIILKNGMARAGIKSGVNTADIGRELITTYGLPFEVISVVLLVALIGAIILSRGEKAAKDK